MRLKILPTIFLLSLLVFIQCCQRGNFQISGAVSDASLDGEYIYLQKLEENRLVNIDSAKVENGKFLFKGIADSAVIRELSFNRKGGHLSPVVFILEKGDMDALIDTLSTVTGTSDNDRLSQFYSQKNIYVQKIQKLMEEYQMASLMGNVSDSMLTAYQGRYDLLRKEMLESAYQFILLNNDNVAGALVFLQTYPDLQYDQVGSVLQDASSVFKNVDGVSIINRYVNEEQKTAVGKKFLNATLESLDGKQVSLSDYVGKGNWVLLDFWASWCAPCRKEFPYLREAYTLYHSKGFQIIGISLDTSRSDWVAMAKDYDLDWIQLSDLKGWESKVAEMYAIQSIPMTILINPQGVITDKNLRQEALLLRLSEVYEKK